MKITCTLWEFAQMIRSCEYYRESRDCEGCVLLPTGHCGPEGSSTIEECVDFEVTDRNEFEKIVIN